VTGASRRIAIGAGIARRLVADGAAVFLHSWSPHDEEQAWGADPSGPEALLAELHQRGATSRTSRWTLQIRRRPPRSSKRQWRPTPIAQRWPSTAGPPRPCTCWP